MPDYYAITPWMYFGEYHGNMYFFVAKILFFSFLYSINTKGYEI